MEEKKLRLIGLSIASLALGVLSLCGWIIPCIGIPVSLAGIIIGIIGIAKADLKPMAIVGVILNALTIIAAIINSIAGAAIGLSGGFENLLNM